jgi:hypothetical protein
VSFSVAGTVEANNRKSQYFTRVVTFEIPIGTNIDTTESITTYRISGKKLLVEYSPKDKIGNVPAPLKVPEASILINGKEVASNCINDYSGKYHFECDISSQKLVLNDTRTKVVDGTIDFRLKNGKLFRLSKNDLFDVKVKMHKL